MDAILLEYKRTLGIFSHLEFFFFNMSNCQAGILSIRNLNFYQTTSFELFDGKPYFLPKSSVFKLRSSLKTNDLSSFKSLLLSRRTSKCCPESNVSNSKIWR